jgi:hypothetical protein
MPLDSVESLTKVKEWLDTAIVVFGLVMAAAAIGSWAAGKRISALQGLTKTQLTQLRDAIAPISDKLTVEIVTPSHRFPTTEKPEAIAKQLSSLFQDSGWQVSLSEQSEVPMYGLKLEERFKEVFHPDHHPSTQAVINGLAKSGIQFSSESRVDPAYDKPVIRIIVGMNPIY